MRTLAYSVLACGLGLLGLGLASCSNSSDDCVANASCASTGGTPAGTSGKGGKGGEGEGGAGANTQGGSTSGNGGTAGTTGTSGSGGEGGGGCDAADPGCFASNETGVFVSNMHGDDAKGDGTKEAPFKSIGKALAGGANKDVYVCSGPDDYNEKLNLDANVDGVKIYGGFECEGWTYSTTRSVQVKSPEFIGLQVTGIKTGVYLENVDVFASDAKDPNASSYGAWIKDSKGVKLVRVKLTAGNGLEGKKGEPGAKGDDGADVPADAGAPQKGKAAICISAPSTQTGGTWSTKSACGSLGGEGGKAHADKGVAGDDGDQGTPTSDIVKPGNDNSGLGATVAGDDGGPGASGSNGVVGAIGSTAKPAGDFSISGGFDPANGLDAKVGFPGQGGGGGGASKGNDTCVGASGGAGGMGGCGGHPGKGGGGGGASVGLLAANSSVELVACTIAAGSGGAGGDGGNGGGGGNGADGASGGVGDNANGIGKGGRGGGGGNGGNGGSGSGGTGGPSYALVFAGTKPVFDTADTKLTPGEGGAPGIGGQVLTAKAPDGTKGASDFEFEIK